jgi:uncharacterized membrane protein
MSARTKPLRPTDMDIARSNLMTPNMERNKRLMMVLLGVLLLLLLPFIAMRFTDEVRWTMSDFVVAGALLLGVGLSCELVMRKVDRPGFRLLACAALLLLLALTWAESAVGVLGTPFAGN